MSQFILLKNNYHKIITIFILFLFSNIPIIEKGFSINDIKNDNNIVIQFMSINDNISYYIDSKDGDDNNHGDSYYFPWRSIDKVNKNMKTFNPGDKILFKRGCTWNDHLIIKSSGNINNHIYFGAYGIGENPIFDLSNKSFSIISVISSYISIENFTLKNADGQGIMCENNEIGVNNINIKNFIINNVSKNGILHSKGGNNILIENVNVNNAKNCGIAIMGSYYRKIHDVVIKDCWISNIKSNDGITIHEGDSTSRTSAGTNFTLINNHCEYCNEEGFDITSGSNILLINNTSFRNKVGSIQVAHSAKNVTIRGHHSKEEPTAHNTGASIVILVGNVTITNSIFEGGSNHIMVIYSTQISEIGNLNFYNNLFSWKSGDMAQFTRVNSVDFRNNIFCSSTSNIGFIKFYDENHLPNYSDYIFDYNLYYTKGNVEFWHKTEGTFNFSQFQSKYNQEQNGLLEKPGFLNIEKNIFKPLWDSVLIDNGITIIDQKDYSGNKIYGIRDIGPYEYIPENFLNENLINQSGTVVVYQDHTYRYKHILNDTEKINMTILPFNKPNNGDNFQIQELFVLNIERKGNYEDYLLWTEKHHNIRERYRYRLSDLKPNTFYYIIINDQILINKKTTNKGSLEFEEYSSERKIYFQVVKHEFPIILQKKGEIDVTTGESVEIIVRAIDNNGIDSIALEYWFDEKTHHVNIPMIIQEGSPQDGKWNAKVNIPSFISGNFYYRIIAQDIDNNIMQTQTIEIKVIDNDPPLIISINADDICNSGDIFSAFIQVEDNIKVHEGKIEYLINNLYGFSKLSYLDGLYSVQVKIPNIIGNFTYWFNISDTSENIINSNKKTIPILDNKDPELVRDLTLNFSLINSKFIFTVYVQDNVDIKEVFVEYLPMAGEIKLIKLVKMSKNYLYEGSIYVEKEFGEFFLYRIQIFDTSNNAFISNFNNVIVETDFTGNNSVIILYPEQNDIVSDITEIISYFYWDVGVVKQILMLNDDLLTTIERPNDEISTIFLFCWDTRTLKDGICSIKIISLSFNGTKISETVPTLVYVKNDNNSKININIVIIPEIKEIFISEEISFSFNIIDSESNEIINPSIEYMWFVVEGKGQIYQNGKFIPNTTGPVTIQLLIVFKRETFSKNISFEVINNNETSNEAKELFKIRDIIIALNMLILLLGLIAIMLYRKNISKLIDERQDSQINSNVKYSKIVKRILRTNNSDDIYE